MIQGRCHVVGEGQDHRLIQKPTSQNLEKSRLPRTVLMTEAVIDRPAGKLIAPTEGNLNPPSVWRRSLRATRHSRLTLGAAARAFDHLNSQGTPIFEYLAEFTEFSSEHSLCSDAYVWSRSGDLPLPSLPRGSLK